MSANPHSLAPGAYTALVTPFDAAGAVDHTCMLRLAQRQLAAGIAGLALFGCTGEEATMPLADRLAVLAALRAGLPADTVLIAAGGASDTGTAVELARALGDAGASAILSVVPPYNRPVPAGLRAHFTAVADASPVPVILSNVPGRTGCALDLDTAIALAAHPNIAGIDDGSGDLGFAMRLIRADVPGFMVFSGEDELTMAMMAHGGHGALSLVSNQVPAQVAQLVAHMAAGNLAGARVLHDAILDLAAFNYCETNPAPVKAALAMTGLIEDRLRLPLVPLSDGHRPALRARLAELSLI
ncbi:MAG: 4-hydroxy-tetrahydrodipicolinate synthase [Rubellimicrobium sp.]|nr:4-hydroxy-tetrahydrodipicolinate synthase [Rubellimicrobium sp.]